MNYLGRPVLTAELSWGTPAVKSFSFDLRELKLGFGSEVFAPLQEHVVHGFDLDFVLQTEVDVQWFDDFVSGCRGKLLGFWLPEPCLLVEVAAGVSGTQFVVQRAVDGGLAESFAQHVDRHLVFARGSTLQAAKVTAVEDLGDGRERLTVDAAIVPAVTPAAGYAISRLRYVRLVDDAERGTFVSEGRQERRLKVVELPLEYAQVETGEQPIYLYRFWWDSPSNLSYHYTSFASRVWSNGVAYEPRAITHRQLKRTVKAESSLDIRVSAAADSPLMTFLPVPVARPLHVQVLEASVSDPDGAHVIWTGQVRVVEDDGELLTAKCDVFGNALRRKIPRMLIQEDCSYFLYDAGSCKVKRNYLETSAKVSANYPSEFPPRIVLELAFPESARMVKWTQENWFEFGMIETGFGVDFELSSIIDSNYAGGLLTLHLAVPLSKVQVGQWVQLVPGCDHTAAMCKAKFRNFVNFGGFVNVPLRNPSLSAVQETVSQGGKK